NAIVDVTPDNVVSAWLVIEADVTPDVLSENDPCEWAAFVAIEPWVIVHPLALSKPSTVEFPRRSLVTWVISSPSMDPPHAASAPAVQRIVTSLVLRFIRL